MDLSQKTIWKFSIEAADLFGVDMPEGSEILSVQEQHGKPCIWALVDPGRKKVNRTFCIYGTGHPVGNVESKKFIGTFQLAGGNLVFHLFELVG